MKIPAEFIEQIKRDVNILEVAAHYFDLYQTGSIYQAACIHDGERNSKSLTFFTDTNSFHCFGCGAGSKQKTDGSDVISFVMWLDHCTFPEAVHKIASFKGLKVPSAEMSEEDKKKQRLLERTLQENRTYYSVLQSRTDMIAYLAGRGIDLEEIAKWRIGFVPKIDPTRVAGRIAFAIMNDWGQTVGFSFRNMEDLYPSEEHPDTGPKYMNSPKSVIFDKGSILYGLNFVKRLIREKDYAVLVEGFGDTILGQKYGGPFVGLMGTSLTQEHIQLLGKFTKNIYVWLDGDKGGINAVLRHLEPLRKEGFIIKVIYTPGQDPDDVIMQHREGLEEFIMTNAIMAGQFEIELLMVKARSDITEIRLRAATQVREILSRISSRVERRIYATQIAQDLSVDVETLLHGVD